MFEGNDALHSPWGLATATGAALTILGTLLPWVNYDFDEYSHVPEKLGLSSTTGSLLGVAGTGLFVLLFGLAAGVLVVSDRRSYRNVVTTAVLGTLALAITLDVVLAPRQVHPILVREQLRGFPLSTAFGAYVSLIGAFVIVTGAYLAEHRTLR